MRGSIPRPMAKDLAVDARCSEGSNPFVIEGAISERAAEKQAEDYAGHHGRHRGESVIRRTAPGSEPGPQRVRGSNPSPLTTIWVTDSRAARGVSHSEWRHDEVMILG